MKILVNGAEAELDDSLVAEDLGDRLILHTPEGSFTAVVVNQGETRLISYRGQQFRIERQLPKARGATSGSGEIRAAMPGQIVDVAVQVGDIVAQGGKLVVIEAMKTQQPYSAPFAGRVVTVQCAVGNQVTDGQLLMSLEKVEP